MLENLTRHFWVLNLITLALVAYFVADGTSELVAAELRELIPPPTEEPRQPRHRRTMHPPSWNTRHRDGSAILERNLFDSAVGPIDPDAEPELPSVETDSDEGALPIVDCATVGDVRVDLTSTVVSEDRPGWSFASVSHDRESYLCRVGDEVDGRTVSRITWRYLFLRGEDDECYVDLLDEPKRKPKRRRKGRLSRRDIKQGIQVISPTERVVDRSLVKRAFSNPRRFARSVRVRPYKRRGQVTGFRLRRIKRNSPLYMLGARKGDIVHSVNGIALTSLDNALAAYQGLRDENQLVFEITRKGRPKELKVHIQ
jgi:type II secretion system protein C